MKKTAAVLAAAAALTMSVYASPQTEFTKGQWEINAGMWNTKTKPVLTKITAHGISTAE